MTTTFPTSDSMKPKPNKRIDQLLGELGLHPHALDPDEAAADIEKSNSPTPIRLTGPCGKSCYSTDVHSQLEYIHGMPHIR